jgi:Ser/Thr protein kinase RdoA (MazF antagonist)
MSVTDHVDIGEWREVEVQEARVDAQRPSTDGDSRAGPIRDGHAERSSRVPAPGWINVAEPTRERPRLTVLARESLDIGHVVTNRSTPLSGPSELEGGERLARLRRTPQATYRCLIVELVPSATEEEALEIARLWDPTARRVARVRSGENSAWAIELKNRRSILRLTNEGHRTRDQIEAELDFVEHLAENGLVVARPLASSSGERVVELPRLTPGEGRGWGVMFARLEGRHYQYYSADIDRPLFRLWGETMGRLHDLSVGFAPSGGRRRPDWWDDAVAGCSCKGVPPAEESLAAREELVTWLRGFRLDANQYGMIHGDFERTNFLLRDGAIGLFDFDDSCHHWFVWDIACALWVFRNAARVERSRFLAWFLEGYSSVRDPDVERLEFFSDLVRLRSIALLLNRLRPRQCAGGEIDDEWAEQTRAWLHSPWRW